MRSSFQVWMLFVLLLLLLPSGKLAAQNKLFIAPQTVSVGDKNVSVPVRLDNDQPLYGFSLSVVTDKSLLKLLSVDLTGTPISDAGWSFGQVLDNGSRITWGIVLDITEPFDINKVVPVGKNVHIANLQLDVTATQAGSASLSFQDIPGTPAAKNTLVGDQGTRVPFTSSPGDITIAQGGGPTFHRGDADNNGQLELTDAVRILGFLFLGGLAPTCMDAADADDNSKLELTDAIRILGFLFLGGVAPAAPGPPPNACGSDPGEAAAHLGCATYTRC